MTGISTYLSNKILDHALRSTSYTSPVNVYLALHSSEPDADGVGGELSSGGYERKVISFAEASSGEILNSSSALFSMPTSTVSWFSIWDASTSGNCLFTGALGTSIGFTSGDTYEVLAGAITISRVSGA